MTDDITKELAETLRELRTKFDSRENLTWTMVEVDAILDRYDDACKQMPSGDAMAIVDDILERYAEPFMNPEPIITRVEVITDNGREYVSWNKDNVITTSLQDDGKTLKIFVTTNTNTEEPKMTITKPPFYYNLTPGDKTLYTVAEDEVSKQWANALSVLIEELSTHSSLSLWGYEGETPTPEKVVEYLRGLIKHREQSAADAVEEVSKPTFHIEPEVIEDLWNTTANYKTFANSIADMMCSSTKASVSKQWTETLMDSINEDGYIWEDRIYTPEEMVNHLRGLIKYREQRAADEELDECCGILEINGYFGHRDMLRKYRRPKPTLKSQALKDFETVRKHSDLLPEILDTIENALKSIPDT
jgi:hypothetical protein